MHDLALRAVRDVLQGGPPVQEVVLSQFSGPAAPSTEQPLEIKLHFAYPFDLGKVPRPAEGWVTNLSFGWLYQ